MDKKDNINIESNKISVSDYIRDNDLLEVTYVPFDVKMEIVSHIIMGVVNSVGGINTSLLRRVATEAFIEAITNIDMSVKDDRELGGFDQLCLHRELDYLIELMGDEYNELKKILDERVGDYLRIETNPSVTINAIYDQMKEYYNTAIEYISNKIQNIDVDSFADSMKELIANANNGEYDINSDNGGDNNEA